ncbi:hypothetical protein V865_004484 [Kwoniella europaea PYCC6329]|uniref:Uncharacterized protein n=1 Tax=Kwoniella europaea PYCC6329 TaxID=1423913 RepID=A0AAX4KJQ8_9TREE
MAPPTDFFSSLRPKSRSRRHGKGSETLKSSGTTYTLNNWVDLDHNGRANHININDTQHHPYDHETERHNVSRMNENEENIDPRSGSRKSSGSKLKRRSMMLLRMVERKTSSNRNREEDKDELKRSIRHPTMDSTLLYEGSTAGPSKSNLSSTPPHTPLTTPSLPSNPYHPFHPQTHPTPNQAEYPGWIGDSDSSGNRTTLKPHRSKVPFNTPEDSPLGIFDVNRNIHLNHTNSPGKTHNGRKGKMTYEELLDLPLPLPNGQPSRYHHSPAWHLQDYEGSQNSVYHQRSSSSNHQEESDGGIINFDNLVLQDQDDRPIPNLFESSSALEALWEYGSSTSSCSSLAMAKSTKDLDLEVDLDLDINAEEYPLPPGMGLSNLPTEMSLTKMDIPPQHPKTTAKSIKSSRRSNLNINNDLSSPLSDTFSLEEEEEEEEEEEPEIKAAIKYRIPLKYQKEEIRSNFSTEDVI